MLLYDLTSTYFECDPPEQGKRRFGYSRDKRSDCVQVVIALIVTPEGFPLAYEVMDGNTADCTTLEAFVERIQCQYGQADRIWVMDRGIPTEAVLEKLRASNPPVRYLVGTPKGRLSALEKEFLNLPWERARQEVGGAARRVGRDEFHRLRGPVGLRVRDSGGQAERDDERAKGRMQKPARWSHLPSSRLSFPVRRLESTPTPF